MDPNELIDMMRVSLLQRFGDIPEAHTFLALNEKKLKNQPLSLDEHIMGVTEVKVWEIHYPPNMKPNPKYLKTGVPKIETQLQLQ